MLKVEPCMELEYTESDPSIIRVQGCNGLFSGYTETYINSKWLTKLLDDLSGFPKSTDSVVEFNDGEDWSIHLKFICEDNLGHCALWMSMKTGRDAFGERENAHFKITFEPVALDGFCLSLSNCLKNGEGFSRLKGLNQ